MHFNRYSLRKILHKSYLKRVATYKIAAFETKILGFLWKVRLKKSTLVGSMFYGTTFSDSRLSDFLLWVIEGSQGVTRIISFF